LRYIGRTNRPLSERLFLHFSKSTIHVVAYSCARSLDRDCRIYVTCVDPTRLLGIPIGACRQEDPLFRRSRKCGDRNDTTGTARATGIKWKMHGRRWWSVKPLRISGKTDKE